MIDLIDFHVTLFFNVMACILTAGLLILSRQLRSREIGVRLFVCLCICNIVESVISILVYASLELPDSIYVESFLLFYTLEEIISLCHVFVWLMYVDYLLYRSADHLKRRWVAFAIPVAILILLVILRGILFFVPSISDLFFEFINTAAGEVVTVLEIVYMVVSVVFIYRYRKNTGRLVLFRISPFIIPIIIGLLISTFTDYSVRALGYSIGLINLYFSMIDIWKYEDSEHKCYNRAYMEKIREYAGDKKKDYGGALVFEVGGDIVPLMGIIDKELPKEVEVLKFGNDRLVAFLEGVNHNLLDSVSFMIEDDVGEYEDENAGEPIDMRINRVIRKKDESALAFVDRVVGT